MKVIQFESQVGDDGVLSLQIPVGPEDARTPVIVTVQPLTHGENRAGRRQESWHEFVESTYGSCAGLGLEEPAR